MTSPLAPQSVSSRRRRIAIAGGLALIIGLGAAACWWAWHSHATPFGLELSVHGVVNHIQSWGSWAVIGSILLMVIHSLIPFPSEFVAVANGMLFGPVFGTAITWIGAMLGACLAFALARILGRPFVDAIVNERHRRAVDQWAERQGAGVLLLSRFVPVISFNVINYAAGLTKLSWWTFLWATGLGILPLTTLMVVTGHQLLHGEGRAWIYLMAAAAIGCLLWMLVGRPRRRNNSAR